MGAVSLQLATVFQETITAGAAQPATNATAPTLNQTQGAPLAPEDTVTLSDPAAAALANGSATGTAQTTGNTSQQQLQQLDQTLQRLGINPQSISLFNRLALLLYANDPAALQQFVQQLQKGVQDVGEGNAAVTSATQTSSQPQAQTLAQILSQNQNSVSAQTALSGQGSTTGQPNSPSTNSQNTGAPPASSQASGNGPNGTSVNVTV